MPSLLIPGTEDLKLRNMPAPTKAIIYTFTWYVGKITKFLRT